MTPQWCDSPFFYRRRRTREVRVGDVGIGGRNPIRVQSMTTPATTDTRGTVAQIVSLVEAGCEIVRVTVPTSADARNLPEIRRELAARKIVVPLVADIHFSPGAALKAIEHVEKIRVNPGNYADRKQFVVREYTDVEYDSELARLAETLAPLVQRAKQLGVAMRIGTNHGSLSDRIVNRYGDSPLGMVESALEFVRICESLGYRELVISMKASNPVVTIQAYRLLAARMAAEGMDYPFHLGVTEAGDGVDGRIKSAIGIGSLLDDGIGDTVRVSLTEDPVAEVPVARRLVAPYNALAGEEAGGFPAGGDSAGVVPFDPFSRARRPARSVRSGPCAIGGEEPVRVEVRLVAKPFEEAAIRAEIDAQAGFRVPPETRADLVEAEAESEDDLARLGALRETLRSAAPDLAVSARLAPPLARALIDELTGARTASTEGETRRSPSRAPVDRITVPAESLLEPVRHGRLIVTDIPEQLGSAVLLVGTVNALLEILAAGTAGPGLGTLAVGLQPAPGGWGERDGASPVHDHRRLASGLAALGLDVPIVLAHRGAPDAEETLLRTSVVLGSLLCDGLGDAVSVDAGTATDSRTLGFDILQGARVRMSRTEFISCPSCGRTLFDLEETTRRIKARTAHLKGLKIAVMGCVVNGPGEMADADFGYVGWGTDRIALFVGKEMVARDIPTREADDRLVDLIKQHGKWQDPVLAAEPGP